jgi:hypothetical protein
MEQKGDERQLSKQRRRYYVSDEASQMRRLR